MSKLIKNIREFDEQQKFKQLKQHNHYLLKIVRKKVSKSKVTAQVKKMMEELKALSK